MRELLQHVRKEDFELEHNTHHMVISRVLQQQVKERDVVTASRMDSRVSGTPSIWNQTNKNDIKKKMKGTQRKKNDCDGINRDMLEATSWIK